MIEIGVHDVSDVARFAIVEFVSLPHQRADDSEFLNPTCATNQHRSRYLTRGNVRGDKDIGEHAEGTPDILGNQSLQRRGYFERALIE